MANRDLGNCHEHCRTEELRKAIEHLINEKLLDVLARRDGAHRLIAHVCSGVASRPVQQSERQLEETIVKAIHSKTAKPLAQAGNDTVHR